MLTILNLASGYGKSQVLFDVSLELGPGEMVCLLGRNGMGKTTTIRTVLGMLPTWAGSIQLDTTELSIHSTPIISRLGIGLVPEGRQIFPNLTAQENLLVGARPDRSGNAQWHCDGIYDLFPALRPRMHTAGSLLSGGEQQMLAIGRALMTNPRVLILDEATEGLAPLVRAQIWDCLGRLRALGQSVLIVDKHLQKLLNIADRFYVIEKGRTVWSGDAKEASRDVARLSAHVSTKNCASVSWPKSSWANIVF